jgi:prevent-host-death family protein
MSTRTVNVLEAKTQLSRLLDFALAGDDVVIARAGKPIARLVPVVELNERTLGSTRWPDFGDALIDPLDTDELAHWE